MDLNLPLHPSMRHPLTGLPVRALYVDSKGKARYPIMGGSQDPNPAPDPDPAPKPDPTPDPDPKPDPKPDPAKDDLGFPANTPVVEMTAEQQAAYHRHQSRRHEGRATAYHQAVNGLTPEQVKAQLDELATLKRASQTDQERAVEDARVEARREAGMSAARTALEFAIGHDPEAAEGDPKNKSSLIEHLDMAKLLTDTGVVDTVKVRALAAQIAPADKDKGNGGDNFDFGGGSRGGSKPAGGVAAGASRYEASKKK